MPTPMTKRRPPPACLRCGSDDVAWILRGEPAMDERLEADLEARRVTLGGCIAWEDQSDHCCNACGSEFRRDGRPVRVPEDDE